MISATKVWAEQVVIQTKNTTMVLNVEGNKQPQYVYFGTRLSDYDLQNMQLPRNGRMDAYPAYGMNCPAEAAIAMRHADGNMSTVLVADYVDEIEGDGNNREYRIRLVDPVYPVTVTGVSVPSVIWTEESVSARTPEERNKVLGIANIIDKMTVFSLICFCSMFLQICDSRQAFC